MPKIRARLPQGYSVSSSQIILQLAVVVVVVAGVIGLARYGLYFKVYGI